MWIWQSVLWPQFSFDSNALQTALVAARRAQGRLLGAAEQLQLLDVSELQLAGWTREALATAQVGLLRDNPPFVLMAMRGRSYLRMQMDGPDPQMLAHQLALLIDGAIVIGVGP